MMSSHHFAACVIWGSQNLGQTRVISMIMIDEVPLKVNRFNWKKQKNPVGDRVFGQIE